jgi:formimidoylglutamase
MAFAPNPAAWPIAGAKADARLTNLFVAQGADIQMAGIAYDASVIGRKGARDGPTGIREALRFIAGHDVDTGGILKATIQDHGDVAGLDDENVLATHATVRKAVAPLLAAGPTLLLGGDHGLTFAHVAALSDVVGGAIGIIVIDAHYDLRGYEGQPTSGTPFRRIIEELDGRVEAQHIFEIGIRPFANAPSLAAYAAQHRVGIASAKAVREQGIETIIEQARERLAGVEHLWISIDIDGLDQSIASGCSSPGAGGLSFDAVADVVRAFSRDVRCRGMDVMEVAPSLDSTGNTCRTAAQLVAAFVSARSQRQ